MALHARGASVVPTEEPAGYRRLTVTLPLINRARRILWYVTGAEKAPMLAALRTGRGALPALRVNRRRALVVADRAALPARRRGR